MNTDKPPRGYLATVFGCYCPRCREGKLFKHKPTARIGRNVEMHAHCPVCGQITDIEVGFYYGTGYVSYMLAVMVSGATFVAWWLLIGFSFSDNRFAWWVGVNAVLLILLQPWLMRLSRSLWLSWFVHYNPHWKEENNPKDYERVVPEHMGNW